jgi:pyruvate formate lyase activating enzyme
MSNLPTKYLTRLDDGRLRCDVCPRACTLADGQRGLCFVRQRQGEQLVLTTYGRSSGFCVDPIEKKPLYHFYPGSSVLSFGTAGCNLTCKFCQNWDISRSREMDTLADEATPEQLAAAALAAGARSVAFTYNEPTIFLEYAIDVANACRAVGVRTVAVTAGYIEDAPRRDFFASIDAANVDLKGFTEDFYRKLCGASLERVKETLVYLAQETSVWLELTTLLIPGYNDSDGELRALARWVREALGAAVPLHFSGFHPDFAMRDVPATPHETLRRARRIALAEGMEHVYLGNVHDAEAETTYCTSCRAPVVVRDWYELLEYRLDARGNCGACGTALAGHFDEAPAHFGRRRRRVTVG